MESKSKKILYNFVVFSLGSFGSKLLVFLLLPLYTTVLTTSEYGTIDLITTTVAVLYPIVTIGLNEAIFRFLMSKQYSKEQVISIGIKIPCIIYSVSLVLALLLNFFIKWEYMPWMLLLLLTQMFFELAQNYLKAIGRSKSYAVIGICQTIILLSLNILFLLVYSFGIKGYLIAYCTSYFLPGVFVFFKNKLYLYLFGKNTSDEYKCTRKAMLKYSVPLIFNTLSWLIIMSSDRYMIRLMIGVEDVGIYSIASKIPTILQTIITIFTTVWEISSNDIYENEKESLIVFYETGTRYYSTVGYCGGSFLLLICPYLMALLAKGDFYQGWVYAPFLIVSVVFSTAGGINGAIYAAYKDNKGVFISTTIGAIINLVLNFIGIKFFGIIGATVSTAISRLFISIYRTKDTERFLKFKRYYLKNLVCIGLIVSQAILLTFISNPVRDFVQMTFFIIILLVNYKTLIEIFKMILSLKKRRNKENA